MHQVPGELEDFGQRVFDTFQSQKHLPIYSGMSYLYLFIKSYAVHSCVIKEVSQYISAV